MIYFYYMKIEWNKVTPYSKALALVLFIALPFIGFYYGTQYGETKAEIRRADQILVSNKAAPERQSPSGLGSLESTSTVQDINNDGKDDSIVFDTFDSGFHRTSELKINDATIRVSNETSGFGGNLDNHFGIVDIDARDSRTEVAIHDSGPSSDDTTGFFQYDGKNIISLGVVPGNWEYMIFDGKGTLTTSVRAKILDTWFYRAEYRLSTSHTFVRVPKSFYERDGGENVVLMPISLQKSPTDPTISLNLQKADKVTITGCDDVKWCQVKNAQGATGWFSLHNFNIIVGPEVHAEEVFYGLSNAD